MIVIPMIDRSNRFREAGYTTPKFMLTWRRKSLFFHALDSFRAYFATERFLIVLRDLEGAHSFVERELLLLDIPRNRVTVVALENVTNGQAETVAAGLRKAQVSPDVPLTIFNGDTFRKDFAYPQDFDPSSVDGYLEVFSGEDEARSFVRSASDRPDERRVAEISEKAGVSDLRCTGLYHFRSCEFYLSLHAEVERLHPGELQGGGRRVAPLCDLVAKRGANIRYVRIAADDVKLFGTPSEYEQRLRETPSGKPLAFCIGGQIRKDRRHLEAIADLARRHEADVYISTWRKRGRRTLLGASGINKRARLLGYPAAHFLPHSLHLDAMFPEVERLVAALPSEDCGAELREIFGDAVIDVEEDDALDLAFDTKADDKHSLRMLYKIWRCNRLKRAGEALRGRKYEGVVRFRPDILPSMKVFTETEMQPGMAVFRKGGNDMFWLCDSETDDRLSGLFGNAVLVPNRKWRSIHREVESWVEQLSLTLKWDKATVAVATNPNLQEQAFLRSLACEALRNGRYSDLAKLTRKDAEILADLIECSDNPSVAGLTIDRLRSMYSAKSAFVVVKSILMSALSISEPPYEDPALRHCADLVLLTATAQFDQPQITMPILKELETFLACFRRVAPGSERLFRSMPDTGQSHDAREKGGKFSQDTSRTQPGDSLLDGLVWIVHRDLLARLGEERFLMIAHSIQDIG